MSEQRMTKEQLDAHIREICGSVVADIVAEAKAGGRKSGQGLVTGNGEQGGTRPREERSQAPAAEKGIVLAGMMICLAATKGSLDHAIDHAKKNSFGEPVTKALEISSAGAGGVLVPPDQTEEVIDALTPRTAVRALGPSALDLEGGVLPIPRLKSTATANYIGEGRDIPKSQQGFDDVVAQAKQLAALVPISNMLLRRGGPRVQTISRNDMLRSMSITEDLKFLRGTGTQFSPKGMRHWAAPANILVAGGASTLAQVTVDLGRLVLRLEESNVAFSKPGWIFAPRTKQFLMTIRDGNGNYAFRDEMLTGKFWGWPFRSTTQIPRNLGVGGNMTEVYLADFEDLVIAESLSMTLALSEDASYIDETGQLVSAFSKNQSVMRVIAEHDFVSRHDESIAVLTDVAWEMAA